MKSVTVVGCGIIGLTTAIALQEKGFSVKIVSKQSFHSTLSQKVGAIWFPFEVHPIEKAHAWAKTSYNKYQEEIMENNGVSFIPFTVAYNERSDNSWTDKLPKDAVRKVLKSELPVGIEMAYEAIVPLAEPPLYLPNLFERFIENGGEFVQVEIENLEELAKLDELVINCTGLGAKELCNDHELIPMRGQILRCDMMNVPSCVNSTNKGELSYVIKRSNDLIIGGTDYEDDWNENIEPSDTDLIIDRFKKIGLTENTPVIIESLVGLRPKRFEVRFEFDPSYSNVFHNYGHGGAGFTVGWGCAIELSGIVLNFQP